jgi:hypothetical protein
MIRRVRAKPILGGPIRKADPASRWIFEEIALDELTAIDEQQSLPGCRELRKGRLLVDDQVCQQKPTCLVQVIEVDLDDDHLPVPRQRCCGAIGFRSSGPKMASKITAVKPATAQ